MAGTLNALFAATVLFVGGHFLLSSAAIRTSLTKRFGESLFFLGYAAIALGSFLWMLLAFSRAPNVTVWPATTALLWIPVLVMPVAVFLVVCGLSTPSPTGLGGANDPARRPVSGIVTVTRHPFLWGTTLWAASHILANGDARSIILMGGVLVLSLGGMWHIDRKKEARLGSDWGPVALTTSAIPLVAALSGRNSIDWAGIGWRRLIVSVVLYLVILFGHRDIIGVSALPL